MDYLALLIGILLGSALGFMMARFMRRSSSEDERSLGLLSEERSRLQIELDKDRNHIEDLIAQLSAETEKNKGLEKDLVEQKAQLEEIGKKFTSEFQNLANKILEEKSEKFTEKNKNNLETILKPLNEKIKDFEKRVENTNKEQHGRHEALKIQLEDIGKLNRQMSEDAQNLVKALKGDTKSQGDWGEMILERILQKSGLRKDQEYTLQESGTNDEGRILRPDAVVNLPDNKKVIVDSKVSLIHYERFNSSIDTKEQAGHLKQFVNSVRKHIKDLSEKHYTELFKNDSLDYVLMFIPIEPAFHLALHHGEDMYTEALEKGIVIVSPTTLMATLRTVDNIWKHERQNKNVLLIAEESGKLYDKFVSLVEDLIKVGNQLNTTKGTYDSAMNKLSEGSGNLVRRAEKIRSLGAKTKKNLPPSIVERSEEIEQDLLSSSE